MRPILTLTYFILMGSSAFSQNLGTGAQGTPTASILIKPTSDSRIKDRKFEGVPAIATSADGKQLFVAWYSGGAAPGPGNYVTLSVSTSGGNEWLNDQLVVYPDAPDARAFDPALWRDPANGIHLFFGMSGNGQLFDGKGGVNTIQLNWNGAGIAPGRIQRLADGVMSNKPIFITKSSKILFPVYVDKTSGDDHNNAADGAFVLASDFKSHEFTKPERYGKIEVPQEIRIHDEPQVLQVTGSEFLALVRTLKGIYYSRSYDYGRTWGKVTPFIAAGPTTSSRFFIGKLSSGNILLVFNNSTTRNNMVAALSTDGGKSWPHKLLLDSRENVSYPDADQSSDGMIHVVFDRERTGAKEILYHRFREQDIVNDAAANVFKARVNKSLDDGR